MKKISLFSFVVKYLGFLKFIPLVPHVFDGLLRLWTLITKSELLDWIDDIESEVLTWQGTNVGMHKYGGLQFNYENKEIGHLHSNGLLDVLLSKSLKQRMMEESRISHHHVFKQSGWISFYIQDDQDVIYAKELLYVAYHRKRDKLSYKSAVVSPYRL